MKLVFVLLAVLTLMPSVGSTGEELPVLPSAFEPPKLPGGLGSVEYDGVTRGDALVCLVFPVAGKCSWSDTFLAPRDGGKRRHHGQDIMAPKVTPLLAVFDGRAYPRRSANHNTLTLAGDNGWTATYMHINNDTPGTDDGLGSDKYAFVAGLKPGSRVRAGQTIAYVGDSGNAESTSPHLHFELYRGDPFAIVNPAHSLRAAQHAKASNPWQPEEGAADEDTAVRAKYGIYNFALSTDGIFVEGEVISTDIEASRIVVSVSSITLVRGGTIALNPARKKVVAISNDTRLYWDDTSGNPPGLSDVHESRRVCILGPNLGVGSILPAKYVVLSR